MTGDSATQQWRTRRRVDIGNGARVHQAIVPKQEATIAQGKIPALIRWSFLLFIFSIPLEAVDLGFKGALSPARIAGLPFFMACLTAPRLCFRRPSAPLWWFAAYMSVAALGGLLTPPGARRQAVVIFITMVQLMVFFWIAANLFRNRMLARRALRTFAVATLVLGLGILLGIQGFSSSLKTRELKGAVRMTALDFNPNDVAVIAAIAAIVLLGDALSMNTKRWQRLLLGAAAVPLVLVIVRTGSLSGVASFLAGLAIFLLPAGATRRRLVAAMLATGVLLGILFIILSNPLLGARLGAVFHSGDTGGRERIYGVALELISERPIAGWGPVVGLNQLGARLNYRGSIARDAHNLLLHLLLEVGIIGAIPFIVGLLLVARAAWRGRRSALGLVPLALVAVVLMANLSHTFLLRKPMWLVLAVALASSMRGIDVRRVGRPLVTGITRVQRTIMPRTGSA